MKSLIVYDSRYGNTHQIALALSDTLAGFGTAYAIHVDEVQRGDLRGINLLVVGSPTQRFAAAPPVKHWLDSLPGGSLTGIRAAAFDTRLTQEQIDQTKILAFLMRIFGYSAERIAKKLLRKGADLSAEPKGFFVSDKAGPLLADELSRAKTWAANLR